MNECLTKLLGIKSLCQTADPDPVFYLDDIEGISTDRLAKLATPKDGSGLALGLSMIDSAARLLRTDIDTIIPSNYRIKTDISSICSSCTFSGFYNNAAASGTGVTIKNMSNSRFSSLIIDSVRVKLKTSGTYTMRIIDKIGVFLDLTADFVADEELTINGIGFETTQKQASIFFTDPAVQLYQISCPANSSCGCGGASKTAAVDIIITGFSNGIEGSTQYGILPCVKVRCSYDQIICDLVTSSPRLFGVALLYLVASKIFDEDSKSTRVNRQASFDKDSKKTEADVYYSLYRERVTGNPKKQILGVAQAVNQNLTTIKDKCIACDNPLGVAWATG